MNLQPSADQSTAPLTLDNLGMGKSGVVTGFRLTVENACELNSDLLRRLRELGFVVGERVRVLQRGAFGGGPIAVRIGSSTFALRPFEAALVSIVSEQ
ncbi:MAG: FeoA family protein [Pseudomonadota bacterium]